MTVYEGSHVPRKREGPGRTRRALTGLARGVAAVQRGWRPVRKPPLHPVLLTITGVLCLSAAAWLVAVPFGLAVLGIGAFVMEWRITG